MADDAGDAAEPEKPLEGGSHPGAVRVGGTVRRAGRPWSPDVLELLRHVGGQGFRGAPPAWGFDAKGREVLGFVEGRVGEPLPEVDGGPVRDPGRRVWDGASPAPARGRLRRHG